MMKSVEKLCDLFQFDVLVYRPAWQVFLEGAGHGLIYPVASLDGLDIVPSIGWTLLQPHSNRLRKTR